MLVLSLSFCLGQSLKEEIMATTHQSKSGSGSKSNSGNAGNFKKDPQKAAEACRKGGESRGRQTR